MADRLHLLQADVPTSAFPEGGYDLATVSFYRVVDRFPDVKEALVGGGHLFVEHHLRSANPTPWGPSRDRRAVARILARNTSGTKQSYPPLPDG